MSVGEEQVWLKAAPKELNYQGFCFLVDGIGESEVNGEVNAGLVSLTWPDGSHVSWGVETYPGNVAEGTHSQNRIMVFREQPPAKSDVWEVF